MSTDITATLAELEQAAGRPERFSRAFLEVLPVTGASVSTIGDVLGSETISATDDLAGRLDELQFDLTEGPCWDAIRTDSVISEPDFTGKGAQRWPTFGRAVPSGEVASMFAFPLSVGELRFGAVDLYCRSTTTLDRRQSALATAMTEVIGRHVLREALGPADGGAAASKYSRRIVHQATGIVLAQLDLPPNDALLVIQARAFSTGQSMMDVAQQIVDGGLRFDRAGDGEATS